MHRLLIVDMTILNGTSGYYYFNNFHKIIEIVEFLFVYQYFKFGGDIYKQIKAIKSIQ